jgi:hypothetical protein
VTFRRGRCSGMYPPLEVIAVEFSKTLTLIDVPAVTMSAVVSYTGTTRE